ncbi:MAG: hypothetical protein HY319_27255 [Armatimonadetes bacterium]|nr:hypothetical protein [Armatimonadota bacterium]
MTPAENNPVTALLQSLHQREGRDYYQLGALGLAVLVGSAAAVTAGPLAGLALAAMLVLALVPFLRAQRDAALLISLRNGRSLEEIRQTRLGPGEMVDGLAVHTLRVVLRSTAWLVVPGLALAMLLAEPGEQRWLSFRLALVWLPALALVTASQSYFAAMLAAWTRDEQATPAQAAGVWIAILPPTLATPWALVGITRGQIDWGLGLMLCGCLWIGIFSRFHAHLGLQWGDRLHETVERLRRRFTVSRNAWVAPWSGNAIVFREMSREAGRVPGGVLGMLASRFCFAIGVVYLPSFLFIHLTEQEVLPRSWGLLLWLSMAAAVTLLQPARAAARLSGALVEEREKGTLESLLATRLSSREFATGWAGVGWIPRCQENVLAVMGLLVMAAFWKVPAWTVLLSIPLMFLNTVAGAYLGLALGAWARNRREAGGDLGVLLLVGGSAALAAVFGLLGASLGEILVWLYFVGGVCLVFGRRIALSQLS